MKDSEKLAYLRNMYVVLQVPRTPQDYKNINAMNKKIEEMKRNESENKR